MIDEREIEQAAPAELPSIIGDLARLSALALARIVTPTTPAVEQADRLLTAEEAAPICGLTVEQLRRRRDLPFRRHVGIRTVRYSAQGIAKWLKRSV